MNNSKLTKVLNTLSAEEMRWLSKFVVSPYYNSNEYVIRLFEYLKKLYPSFRKKKLEEELVFAEVFKDEKFDIKRLRVVSSRLFAVVEQFLVVENGKKNSFEFQQKLTEEYGRRNLYQYFEKGINKTTKELNTRPFRDSFHFYHKMLLNRQYYEHPATNRQSKTALKSLTESMDCLDIYLSLSKMELSLAILSRQENLQQEYKIKFLETVETEVERYFSKIPTVILYKNVLQLSRKNNDTLFEETKEVLNKNVKDLSDIDKRNISLLLTNYCTRREREGGQGFQRKRFDLKRLALKNNYLLESGEIPGSAFWNMTTEAVKLKEFDWVDKFILSYQNYLNNRIKKDYVIGSQALVSFYKKEYDKVIILLINHKSDTPFFKITVRTLLIRTYFMLYVEDAKYDDFLFSQLSAFEKYIRREKNITQIRKEGYLNFVLYIKKLATNKESVTNLVHLRKEIDSTSILSLRQWILDILKHFLTV